MENEKFTKQLIGPGLGHLKNSISISPELSRALGLSAQMSLNTNPVFSEFCKTALDATVGIREGLKIFEQSGALGKLVDASNLVTQNLRTAFQDQSSLLNSSLRGILQVSESYRNIVSDSLNLLHSSGALDSIALVQRNIGGGILEHLERNKIFYSEFLQVAKDIQVNPEKYEKILQALKATEIEEAIEGSGIAEWIKNNAFEVKDQLSSNLLAFFVLMIIGNFFNKQFDLFERSQICIARSGCNIREQGSKASQKITAVPYGSELRIIEDEGKWKKVVWEKDSEEVYEGWVYCSLLKRTFDWQLLGGDN